MPKNAVVDKADKLAEGAKDAAVDAKHKAGDAAIDAGHALKK